jgi:hypothetical protein
MAELLLREAIANSLDAYAKQIWFNDWVSERSEYTRMHAFVNSQDLALTASRGSIENTPQEFLDDFKATVPARALPRRLLRRACTLPTLPLCCLRSAMVARTSTATDCGASRAKAPDFDGRGRHCRPADRSRLDLPVDPGSLERRSTAP